MEAAVAVPSRLAFSAASRFPSRRAVAGDKSSVYRVRCQSLATPMALVAAAAGKGGGVLDRPVEKIAPGRKSEFDVNLFCLRLAVEQLAAPSIYSGLCGGFKWSCSFVHFSALGARKISEDRKSRKMTPPYRVMLHNDNYNRREYVVQVLMKVIPGMTVDNAVNIMQEAHVNGLSVVIVCSQSEAEEHCTSLRGNGLRSSIEPASGGC
ncbi:hypothetical protein ACP70R_047444 [Stipagrostis hirtigluma subsp. patula]